MNSVISDWVWPDWPAPAHVWACTTTRVGGVSQPPYDALNLAAHVQDDIGAVEQNRQRLQELLALPAPPLWLEQVHGTRVCDAARTTCGSEGDGAFLHYGQRDSAVCAVMTADCLPVVFCDVSGEQVAVVHAGWRGLAAGVLEAALERFAVPAGEILVWLGPAIGPQAFEVGAEVREEFMRSYPQSEAAFQPSTNGGRWLADIYMLARIRLQARGLKKIYGGGLCTFSDADRFYSYRREPVTGRMATLVWFMERL